MDRGASKLSVLMMVFVLLLTLNISTHKTGAVQGRPLSSSSSSSSSSSQQRGGGVGGYWKILTTLGMVCQCCDGVAGGDECTSTWNLSCSNLHCSPWKSHS